MSSVFNMKNFVTALCLLLAAGGYAQAPAAPVAASTDFAISTNTMLVIIAAILLFITIMLTTVVFSAIELYKNNLDEEQKSSGGSGVANAVIMLFLLMASGNAFAQAPAAAAPASTGISEGLVFWLLFSFILVEVAVIFYLVYLVRSLTTTSTQGAKAGANEEATLWESLNKFRPISEESKIDMGHSYDGIRELDNVTPPWFSITFAMTIVFALVYMYRYHISHTAPLMIEEYEMSVQAAKAEQDALAKLNPPKSVDENNLTLLGPDDIAKGKATFTKNCATCHAQDGGGGAGPNLTDDYWIHKGGLKDIYLSVKHGYPDKGMPSWEAMMNPEQINQVTSFIKSLRGTRPAQPKEKQGDLYTEETASAPAADSTTAAK